MKKPHWNESKFEARCQLPSDGRVSVHQEGDLFRWYLQVWLGMWVQKEGVAKNKEMAKREAIRKFRGLIQE